VTQAEPDPAQAAETKARRAAPVAALCLSAFGLGLSPIMPGTVASLAVAGALFVLPTGPVAFLGLVIVFLIAGSWVTLRFAGDLGEADGKHGDPGWVVSDEVAGQALATLGALPAIDDWRLALLAFVLFRIFDMTKLGPVGKAEKCPGAVGVLLDDLVAGALAGIITLAVGLSGLLG
jgi:phosphatidylglycerophosphatase A